VEFREVIRLKTSDTGADNRGVVSNNRGIESPAP